jgi:hypothetical protein
VVTDAVARSLGAGLVGATGGSTTAPPLVAALVGITFVGVGISMLIFHISWGNWKIWNVDDIRTFKSGRDSRRWRWDDRLPGLTFVFLGTMVLIRLVTG